MIALTVALSLALDVPFLAQTDRLCGGAAAAMVLRYLGDAHADVRSFEPIVDRRAGGIANGALVGDLERRGYTAETFAGSIAALHARLQQRQPVIVLLNDRRTRYHYVVVVGADDNAIVVHDPSWGPSRSIANDVFERAWKPSGFWSLAISGRPMATADRAASIDPAMGRASPAPTQGADSCDRLLDEAIARIGAAGPQSADAILESVRAECPRSAGPLRELAGVRFAQQRWTDAAFLARQALARDRDDAYAADVLGSSLFMQDDAAGALDAWNRIGKPRVDRVQIAGLHHARYQTIASALDLEPGDLLTPGAFARAARRLDDLPDRSTARLSLRPQPDGFAIVDAAIAERAVVPRQPLAWTGIGIEAAVDRQVDAALPGFTGQGEVWEASWRWWTNRPQVGVAFAAPHVGGTANVWRVDAAWDEQTYASAAAVVRESRVHGGLTVSDWLTGNWRYAARVGFDSWNGVRRAASIGGSIERRLLHDRVSLSASGDKWAALTGDPGFGTLAASAVWRRSRDAAPWSLDVTGSAHRASDAAPLGLWAGAGDGRARPDLLRAHPMLDDGIVQTNGAFGRTLVTTTVETTRWFDAARPARIGVAMFVDAARASRTLSDASSSNVDVGGGFRLRLPGAGRTLRVDVAHGLRDGANALTVGWTLNPRAF